MGCDGPGCRIPSSIETRCQRLVDKLRNVPLSHFTVDDFASLHTLLVGDSLTGNRVPYNEGDLKRLEKIAKDFKRKRKRGAR